MAAGIPRLENSLLTAGTLLDLVRERSREALAARVLAPLATESRIVSDGGIDYIIRVLSSLARKSAASTQRRDSGNPFLRPDPVMLVGNLSATHRAVLNKFNVLDLHLLIVTREYEHQERLLTRADFDALATCLVEYEGLGFYNGGRVAGASQEHKHLQYVPLPLAEIGMPIPIDEVLCAALDDTGKVRCSGLPFSHLAARLPMAECSNSGELADLLLSHYNELTRSLAIQVAGTTQERPYNLLVTRKWMLLIPRTLEFVEEVSINALGFAGTLLVKDEQQLAALMAIGPAEALRRAAAPGERA